MNISQQTVIRFDRVGKRYDGGPPALDGVSLTVRAGEAVAVLGPSGSGKSTLLNLIAGLDRPSEGEVTVDGVRVDGLDETGAARFRRARIGMVFQFFNLLDDLTVLDNVLLPAQLSGLPRGAARARADELLESLGVQAHAGAYPGRLSGGQRQRVAVARALMNRPPLLLADEPTGALDSASAAQQQSDRVAAVIAAQPGTAASYGTANLQMPVSVASGGTNVIVYQGDSTWGHYPLVSGHWLGASGQAVVPTQFLAATGTRLGDTVVLAYQGRRVPLNLVGEVFDTKQEGLIVMTEAQSFGSAIPMGVFQIEVKPGTDVSTYVSQLASAVKGVGATAQASKSGTLIVVVILDAISALMTLMLVLVAGLGVLGAVILDTRERVHDLGVYRAIGMTPRQATSMVLTSVGWLGVIAGALGVPAGLLLHTVVMRLMGDAIGATMPSQVLSVYNDPELVLLVVGGVAIALIGALGPAGWAGRLRTATALRTE